MNELLKILLSLSISGSLLIFILFLCKPLFKEKLSKQWQYYIWLIVIARLLLPFAPETNLMGSIFQQIGTSTSEAEITPQPIPDSPSTDFFENDMPAGSNEIVGDEQPQSTTPVAQTVLNLAIQNIWLLWLIVAVALFIRKITAYQSFVKYMKAGRIEVSDIKLWDQVGKLVEQSGVKSAVSLYTNSLISSPLLIGFFKPCIMLPTTELSGSDFQYTILHELTHYKRRDMFYKWLVQIVVCVHWFNPLAYLMGREINRACELSCDEAVIRNLDRQEQRAYGDTLLNAVGVGGNYRDVVASVTLYESQELLKERLDAIMKFKKKSKVMVAITLALTTMLCVGATAVGAYANPEQQTDTIKATENQNNNTNQNIITVPIDIKAVKNGTFIWLGEFNLSYGDKMYYDVSAEKGNGLQTGFAAPEDDPLNRTYFTMSNKREDGILNTKGDFIFAAPVKPGQYNLFIRATDGDLTNVKGSITIEYTEPSTAILKIPVDLNSSNKAEVSYDKEYAKWDITPIDDTYYYQNVPVRIFIDLRADNSFANFAYNENGSIDLRLIRNSSDSIVKVEHMTKAEADEILSDLDVEPTKEDVLRLTLEEVPDAIQAAVNSCDDKTWCVIDGDGRQYIYYNNLPHNYAYQYEPNQNSLKIVDIGKSTGNYVLLSVPLNSNLTISYNSKSVTYSDVPSVITIKGQLSTKENASAPNQTDSIVLNLSSEGQSSIIHSSSFEAKANQTLILDIQSSITGGTVDLFLFSPAGKEHRITIGGSDKAERVTLSAGRWAYNCTGFFESGAVTIKGQLSEK